MSPQHHPATIQQIVFIAPVCKPTAAPSGRGLQSWIHKQQPIHTRRLDCIGPILQMLQGEEGSGTDMLTALDSLMRLDESTLLTYLPLLCDAVILETGFVSEGQVN